MVHRDIKPSNLMLSHDGGRAVIKLLDFGLARATREQSVIEQFVGEGVLAGDLGTALTRRSDARHARLHRSGTDC